MAKSLRSPRHRALITLLLQARHKSGMTQADLAAAIDRPQSFIAKVEGGERRLEVLEFADLARALGLDPGKTLNKIA